MSGYIEVMVTGGCRAYIEAASVSGVITAKGADGSVPATAEATMSILLRSGEVLAGVYGVSPNRLLIHVDGVKLLAKRRVGYPVVAFLDSIEAFEANVEEAVAAYEGTLG